MKDQVEILNGDIFVDDRGSVSFVNSFNFEGVKRFYVVENHQAGFVRAWHGHKTEAKYITVLSGAAIIAVIPLTAFDKKNDQLLSRSTSIRRVVLTEQKPTVMFIPPGYANGCKTLARNTKVIYYSTKTIEESCNDCIRFDPNEHFSDVWDIIER